jgi:hypothetical protein
VHDADVAVKNDRHRPAGHLGVTVRDRNSGLLVQGKQHGRVRVAQVVHQAVVQAAEARAGNERDVLDVDGARRPLAGDSLPQPRAALLAPARAVDM